MEYSLSALDLQPLRLPSGWIIIYHDFRQLDPEIMVDETSGLSSYFREDLLQIEHQTQSFLIDVGWYPEGASSGAFRAVVVRTFAAQDDQVESWQTPLESHHSRSRTQVVTMIESWAEKYSTFV